MKRQLQNKIAIIANAHQVNVGVSVLNFEGTESFNVKADQHFAMQSVFKFHLALAILHLVDEDQLKLEKEITLRKENIDVETHSPMRDVHPNQDITISIIRSNACSL